MISNASMPPCPCAYMTEFTVFFSLNISQLKMISGTAATISLIFVNRNSIAILSFCSNIKYSNSLRAIPIEDDKIYTSEDNVN